MGYPADNPPATPGQVGRQVPPRLARRDRFPAPLLHRTADRPPPGKVPRHPRRLRHADRQPAAGRDRQRDDRRRRRPHHRPADVPAVFRDDDGLRDRFAFQSPDESPPGSRHPHRAALLRPPGLHRRPGGHRRYRGEEAPLETGPLRHQLPRHTAEVRPARRPLRHHVVRTTRALVKKLGLRRDQWTQTYQSLFGRDEWLKPYTDATLEKLAHKGVKRVFAILPGFTADCLETIDEIGLESLEEFHKAGGEDLKPCPCLNDHPEWIDAMEQIVRDEGHGWL